MFRSLHLFIAAIGVLGMVACQRQAVGGFLPSRAPARVMTPVAPPIYRAVGGLGAAIDAHEIDLPSLERQLALAERRPTVNQRLQPVRADSANHPQPSPGTMTSLADQLGVSSRGAQFQALQQIPPFEPDKTTPAAGRVRHQPTVVDNAIAKSTAKPKTKIDKAQRRKTTGSNLRPALLVLAAAVILMVIGLKL